MSDQRKSKPVSLLTALLQAAWLSKIYHPPAILSSVDSSFPEIQTLSLQFAITLFTPAIHSDVNQDPFDPLGRALQANHQRLRHVPYALNDGYTYVHETHLDAPDLGAVVIVVFDGNSVEKQKEFAEIVKKKVGDQLPMVLIWIGKVGRRMGFKSVLKCDTYSRRMLVDTARLLFSVGV
jgi:hypothetical protein